MSYQRPQFSILSRRIDEPRRFIQVVAGSRQVGKTTLVQQVCEASGLAAVLNTSLSTVRKWEIGEKHPSGPSLKLLSLLDRKGLEAVL